MESVGNNGTFDLSGTIDEVAAKYDGTYPYFDFANIFTSKVNLKRGFMRWNRSLEAFYMTLFIRNYLV